MDPPVVVFAPRAATEPNGRPFFYKIKGLPFDFERKIKSIGRCCRALRGNMTYWI